MLWSIFAGVIAIVAVSGLGRLVLRLATGAPLPLHWYAALSMLSGMGAAATVVEIVAAIGTSRLGFEMLGAVIAIGGLVGHIAGRGRWKPLSFRCVEKIDFFAVGLLGGALVLSFLAALAPSTKIDELNYHMLVGRRIVEDQGLHVYQLPVEQAIFPQMGYQAALSVLYAMGTPDSGNLLSFAFGIVLLLFAYGLIVEETQDPRIALIAVTVCAVGLYPSVWYVTSGPHALGDLGTVTAAGALFVPGSLPERIGARGRAMACVLASTMAAFTKISLMPIGILISVAALLLVHESRLRVAMLATGIWLGVHGPLILWTLWYTGSPFGAATAKLFHSIAYEPAVFAQLAATKKVNQTGLLPLIRMALLSLNGGVLLLFLAGVWSGLTRWRRLGFLVCLLVFQALIIALLLPHDFRFLGGLQYACVAAGAIAVAPIVREIRRQGVLIAGVALLACPWLIAQAYYVLPFAAVDAGLVSRAAFLDRYVAFMQDFRSLDKLLPPGADMYVTNLRLPSIYSPRPVIYSLSDWDGLAPLFHFLVMPSGDVSPSAVLDTRARVVCSDEVYRNNDAILETYRTPGHEPTRGTLVVQRCESSLP